MFLPPYFCHCFASPLTFVSFMSGQAPQRPKVPPRRQHREKAKANGRRRKLENSAECGMRIKSSAQPFLIAIITATENDGLKNI